LDKLTDYEDQGYDVYLEIVILDDTYKYMEIYKYHRGTEVNTLGKCYTTNKKIIKNFKQKGCFFRMYIGKSEPYSNYFDYNFPDEFYDKINHKFDRILNCINSEELLVQAY